jgi:hypothetical protein
LEERRGGLALPAVFTGTQNRLCEASRASNRWSSRTSLGLLSVFSRSSLGHRCFCWLGRAPVRPSTEQFIKQFASVSSTTTLDLPRLFLIFPSSPTVRVLLPSVLDFWLTLFFALSPTATSHVTVNEGSSPRQSRIAARGGLCGTAFSRSYGGGRQGCRMWPRSFL